MELPSSSGVDGGTLDIWWDTGHALAVDIHDPCGEFARITLGPREAASLRNWLVHTTLTQEMDAPHVEHAYCTGGPLTLVLPPSASALEGGVPPG